MSTDTSGAQHPHGDGLQPVDADAHEHSHEHRHGIRGAVAEIFSPHGHDAVDSLDTALESSRRGIRAVKISFVALLLTALLQLVVIFVSGSVALLATGESSATLASFSVSCLRYPPLPLSLWRWSVQVSGPRITMIGVGGLSFGPTMVNDVIHMPELAGGRLMLHDVNEERLLRAYRFAVKLNANVRAP